MIRFGVVGAGNIAHKFLRDIRAVDNAVVTAVASRSLAKAKTFASQYDIVHAFEGYEAMASSDVIDAVYIATPHNFHKEHSILFMTHKKHVLCEKPIAVNQAELQEMIVVATTHKVVLMEAMWTRFLPAIRALQSILEEGSFGSLQSLEVSFGFPLTDHATADGRLMNRDLAGGSLLDLGVYCVTMFQLVSSDPIATFASSALMSKTGVDLMTTVDITLDNQQKTIVQLSCAQDRLLSKSAILTMEHGTIEVPDFWSATSLIVNGVTQQFPHKESGFEYEIEHFVETIESNQQEDSIMTHHESMRVMALLDRIRDSIGLKYPFE